MFLFIADNQTIAIMAICKFIQKIRNFIIAIEYLEILRPFELFNLFIIYSQTNK